MPTWESQYTTSAGTWSTNCGIDTGSTTASSTYYVWQVWTAEANPVPIAAQPLLSEEEIHSLQVAAEEREAKKQEAKQRAKDLLLSFLSPEQIQSLETMSAFVVRSELGRLYRIRTGRVQNIDELDDAGNIKAELCAHPRDYVPDFDTMLTQALMLQYNETEFRAIANIRQLN